MGGELTIPLALKQSWSQGDPKHVPIALRQQLGIVSAVGDRPRPEIHRLNAALRGDFSVTLPFNFSGRFELTAPSLALAMGLS